MTLTRYDHQVVKGGTYLKAYRWTTRKPGVTDQAFNAAQIAAQQGDFAPLNAMLEPVDLSGVTEIREKWRLKDDPLTTLVTFTLLPSQAALVAAGVGFQITNALNGQYQQLLNDAMTALLPTAIGVYDREFVFSSAMGPIVRKPMRGDVIISGEYTV
jgi:hypothetical protein